MRLAFFFTARVPKRKARVGRVRNIKARAEATMIGDDGWCASVVGPLVDGQSCQHLQAFGHHFTRPRGALIEQRRRLGEAQQPIGCGEAVSAQ